MVHNAGPFIGKQLRHNRFGLHAGKLLLDPVQQFFHGGGIGLDQTFAPLLYALQQRLQRLQSVERFSLGHQRGNDGLFHLRRAFQPITLRAGIQMGSPSRGNQDSHGLFYLCGNALQ